MILRPFFSFFGGKWRDAYRYPRPLYDTIIEPFAGSAGYSLRHFRKKVILCDLDPDIAGLWKYLIHVSPQEILNLPDVPMDIESIDDMDLHQEAKRLIGFWLARGNSTPRKSPSAWMRGYVRPNSFWGPHVRSRIAEQVGFIRHWEVYECSYEDCLDIIPLQYSQEATWFIDPPYQEMGKHYRKGSSGLDYQHLGTWCKELGHKDLKSGHKESQVIVCENLGADWMDFEFLAETQNMSGSGSQEVIWTNVPRDDDPSLF
jgi:site-specific DNA-adenine methylase